MTSAKGFPRLVTAFSAGISFCLLIEALKEGTTNSIILYSAILLMNFLILFSKPKTEQ
jgi:hypothetical protein